MVSTRFRAMTGEAGRRACESESQTRIAALESACTQLAWAAEIRPSPTTARSPGRTAWFPLAAFAAACGAALTMNACTSRHAVAERTYIDDVAFEQLDAEWVRARSTTTRRGDKLLFIAPVLRREQIVDPQSGGAPGEGEIGLHSVLSGYLLAEQGEHDRIKYYAVFQWNLIQGRNRYAGVTLPDGRPLPFRAGSTELPTQGVASDFALIDTLIVELPEQSLRLVPPSGLRLTILLDSGASFQVTPPQAYVRGFLRAVHPEGEQLL